MHMDTRYLQNYNNAITITKLRKIVESTGAKSTDMQSPETADHLCSKCDSYAACWAPKAEEIWNARKMQIADKKKSEEQ